jgi:hypothetical protein
MLKINILISQRHKKEKRMELCTITFDQLYSDSAYKYYYYIRLYFTVFLLARSNTRDIQFSNILISKKQFLCNKKVSCTFVQNQWMKLHGTRVQYDFLLHRNCFLLINMLENLIKLEISKIKKKNLNFQKNSKW